MATTQQLALIRAATDLMRALYAFQDTSDLAEVAVATMIAVGRRIDPDAAAVDPGDPGQAFAEFRSSMQIDEAVGYLDLARQTLGDLDELASEVARLIDEGSKGGYQV